MDFFSCPIQMTQDRHIAHYGSAPMKANNPDFMGSEKQLEGVVDPTKRTLYVHTRLLIHTLSSPYVTGTSVVALKYKDGVMMAADTLGMGRM